MALPEIRLLQAAIATARELNFSQRRHIREDEYGVGEIVSCPCFDHLQNLVDLFHREIEIIPEFLAGAEFSRGTAPAGSIPGW